MAVNVDKQMQSIITGAKNYNAGSLAMGLLITRLKTSYKKSPTEETLKDCIRETNTFIVKYERVLAEDLNAISQL